jgi:DNA-binding beta-propeller fold protein YncE
MSMPQCSHLGRRLPARLVSPRVFAAVRVFALMGALLALAQNSRVLATEFVLGTADYQQVVKTNGVGDTLWQTTVGDVRAVAVNPSDGSIAASLIWDQRVVKLDAGGGVIWDKPIGVGSHGIAVDPRDGSIVVATYYAGRVIKLDAGGTVQWDRNIGYVDHLWTAVNPVDGSIAIAAGEAGVVLKLDSAGNVLWQRTLGGFAYESIAFNSADGSVFAATSTGDVHKFDSAGTLLWKRNVGAFARSVAVNPANGRVHIATTDNRIFCLDANGNQQWVTAISATLYIGPKLVVDPADGGIVAATVVGQHLLKFDASGTLLWDKNVGANLWAIAVAASAPPPPPPSATDIVHRLASETAALNLPRGFASALLAKLDAADSSLARNNAAAARGQLQAYGNELAAQRGKAIPASDADRLRSLVNAALALLP